MAFSVALQAVCLAELSRLLLPVHMPPGDLLAGMQPPTLQHDVGDASENAGKTRFTCCGFGGGKKRSTSHK